MHHFGGGELAGLDGVGTVIANAAGEFGSIQIADAQDFAGDELAFATGDAGRQQALAVFAQGFFRAVIHEQGALGMMKEGDPTFAALESGRLRNEEGAFFFTGENVGEHIIFMAGGDDERDAGADHDFGGLDF
ncbi:MAG: hypothetical protein JWQ71_1284 [Pedosphaera sp.]|nr:hypothetical protein [Pedosphaera sp.]